MNIGLTNCIFLIIVNEKCKFYGKNCLYIYTYIYVYILYTIYMYISLSCRILFSLPPRASSFDSGSMECYTILGSEGRTDKRGQRRENRGRWRERKSERDGRRLEGGKVDRVDGGKARGEDGGSDEQDKVGERRTRVGVRWRRGQGVAYMYLRYMYSRRTHD